MPRKAPKNPKRKRAPNKRPSPLLRFSIDQVAEALRQADGKPCGAARILQESTGKTCSHVTVLNYCKRHPVLDGIRTETQRGRDAQVAAALEQADGYLSVASDILDRITGRKWTYGTLSAYIRARPHLSETLEDLEERRKDALEIALFRRAFNGSDSVLTFLGRTKLRDRGYGDRLDVSSDVRHSGEVTVKHYTRADLEAMSPADRASAYRDVIRGDAKVIDLQPIVDQQRKLG